MWFRQGIGAYRLPGGDRGDVFPLLLFGPELHDAVTVQGIVDRHDHAVRGIRLADLLQRQDVGQRIHASSAIFLGDLDAHEAHLPHLFDRGMRELSTLVELCGHGNNFLLGKIPRRIADHLMFFTQGKHGKIRHSSSGW